MKSKSVNLVRVPSLMLAAALQVLPIVRAALPAAEATVNVLAIVLRWTTAAAAALGGVHAVSGASTTITNPLKVNATNGIPFSLRLTTAPDQAHYWSATGLPPNLTLTGVSGQTLWKITGTPAVIGTYNVGLTAKDQASSGLDRTVKATLVITILEGPSPPSITTQPLSQTVTQGMSASFTVTATSTDPPKYQWRFQNSALAAKTNSTLLLNPVTAANAGNYDVIVSNAGGSVTSSVATLTVVAPPTITSQPSNQTVLEGQNTTFAIAATGTAPLNFQWRFQGANLAGENSPSLILNPVTTANAGNYDVVVSNVLGVVTSQVASLTVNVPPFITTPPVSQIVTQGQNATFTLAATGTTPLTYFWRRGPTVVSISPNAAFTITNAQLTDADNYSVTVSNIAGTVTSSAVSLSVIPTPQPPFISRQPGTQIVVAGTPATFNVTAGGSSPLQYQWHFNNDALLLQTNQSLTIPTTQAANLGSYFVVVTNLYGSVTSSVATLEFAAPPVIVAQPQSQTNLAGTTALFSVDATSSTPLSYRWQKDGVALTDNLRRNGSQSTSLSISSVQTNDAGNYTVILTNIAGAVTSQVAVLSVTPVYAPIVVQVSGSGTVSPDYNGQLLVIGSSYTMTAIPDVNQAFSSWSGSVSTNTAVLTFVMQSNLVLQANFVPMASSFTNGTYNGLFSESAGVFHYSSGFAKIRTTTRGTYSGRIIAAGHKYSISGKFDSSGNAVNVVQRGVQGPLTVMFEINPLNADQLLGSITGPSWLAELVAYRSPFGAFDHPAPQKGVYTIIFPGSSETNGMPQGHGAGAVRVDAAGGVHLKGKLADGSATVQSAMLSPSGSWPLYVRLYSGQGSMLGWLQFTNRTGDDVSGTVNWIRNQQPSNPLFQLGFNFQTDAAGSRYTAPLPGARILNWSRGNTLFNGGNLTHAFTNHIGLTTDNRAVNFDANKLTLSFTFSSGLFKGSVADPYSGKVFPFRGAVFQKQNSGAGYFLGRTESGSVQLNP